MIQCSWYRWCFHDEYNKEIRHLRDNDLGPIYCCRSCYLRIKAGKEKRVSVETKKLVQNNSWESLVLVF